jgi:hypothetical protein
MIEESGSGRPKNTWIRIRNTEKNKTGSELMSLLPKLKRLSVSKLVPDPVLSRFRP